MAAADLEVFIRERAAAWDETIDVSEGSPFDTQVIQPVLRRLGADPFTLDLPAFIETRLRQEFPDLAIGRGDATTDILKNGATLLFDPVVREIQRVKASMSMRDPSTLTLDEAAALGANVFNSPRAGDFSKGQVRLYFSSPQKITVSPSNFVTSRSGLHFFPSRIQSIRLEEMLLNAEGSLFYFDVSLVAEKAGTAYDIGPDELVVIANLPAVVRLINKRRFRGGAPAETPEEFVDRAQQEMSERSLVTTRGIAATLSNAFTEVSRLAIVGHNDPEMQRDVLRGGSLGEVRAFGLAAAPAVDGENQIYTRRVTLDVDLVAFPNGLFDLVGPVGPVRGWALCVVSSAAFDGVPPAARDLAVARVVSSTQLDLEEQVLKQSLALSWPWTLRKREVTLAEIPGGILFPDGPNGTVSVPEGEVHVGGMTDVLTRGSSFESASLILSAIVDEKPILAGYALDVVNGSGVVELKDFTLGTNYVEGDETHAALLRAFTRGWSIQILEGPAAGSYRVVTSTQALGSSPQLTLDPTPPYAADPAFQDLRWELIDTLELDLVEPKDIKISGTDLQTVQASDEVETLGAVSFDEAGAAEGDILRIANGPDAGDYTVQEVTGPFLTRLRLDRPTKFSSMGLRYQVFTKNPGGGVVRPLVRVTSVDLLDSTGQPTGSKIPYGRVVDVRSSAFANVGQGTRFEARDGVLGICGPGLPSGAAVNGQSLTIRFGNGATTVNVVFSGVNPIPLATVVAQINAAVGLPMAVIVGGNRLGLIPQGFTEAFGAASTSLLGGSPGQYHHSRQLQSNTLGVQYFGGWVEVDPDLTQDVLHVTSGKQAGFYNKPRAAVNSSPPQPVASTGLTVDHDFAPEIGVSFRFGSRSIGTARCFFLEPVGVEFTSDEAVFTAVGADGIELRFFPDPLNSFQKIPALPSGIRPKDGDNLTTPSGDTLTSLSIDFVAKNVLVGDVLVLDYIPVTGTINLPDPVPNLQFKTLNISIDGQNPKTITFLTDSISIPAGAVTREGVATQINQAVGQTVAKVVQVGGDYLLEFEAAVSIGILGTGTANASVLGAGFVGADRTNVSPNAGRYTITSVALHSVTIDATVAPFGFASNLVRQQFSIFRPAAQRLGPTQMQENATSAGLYYMDVQLVSEGPGDLWNIPSQTVMSAEGYLAEGYYLSTGSETTSFSPVEDLRMHVPRAFLELGVNDDPENATQLAGQNLQVSYDFSSLVSSVNSFITSENDRVVCSSPLGRHLIPIFVRFDLEYSGGSKENVVLPALESWVQNVQPNEPLESSDIQYVVQSKGANSILNPIELVGIVYRFDRSIVIDRSRDRLATTRLAAFIPDRLNVVRKTAT